MTVRRCAWAGHDPLMVAYHDEEWGVAEHDDRRLFELITLEGAQAGLSWTTILRKRDGYRRAFAGFDPAVVAQFDAHDVERLLQDASIVRHRGKIESTIANAAQVLGVQRDVGSLDALVWSFVDGPIARSGDPSAALPSQTDESRALSKELKRRGFRFVGPTTVYAFMQAAGLVDDHDPTCFRHRRG
jgi:DNA-3-methyladenine glycosylase I